MLHKKALCAKDVIMVIVPALHVMLPLFMDVILVLAVIIALIFAIVVIPVSFAMGHIMLAL